MPVSPSHAMPRIQNALRGLRGDAKVGKAELQTAMFAAVLPTPGADDTVATRLEFINALMASPSLKAKIDADVLRDFVSSQLRPGSLTDRIESVQVDRLRNVLVFETDMIDAVPLAPAERLGFDENKSKIVHGHSNGGLMQSSFTLNPAQLFGGLKASTGYLAEVIHTLQAIDMRSDDTTKAISLLKAARVLCTDAMKRGRTLKGQGFVTGKDIARVRTLFTQIQAKVHEAAKNLGPASAGDVNSKLPLGTVLDGNVGVLGQLSQRNWGIGSPNLLPLITARDGQVHIANHAYALLRGEQDVAGAAAFANLPAALRTFIVSAKTVDGTDVVTDYVSLPQPTPGWTGSPSEDVEWVRAMTTALNKASRGGLVQFAPMDSSGGMMSTSWYVVDTKGPRD